MDGKFIKHHLDTFYYIAGVISGTFLFIFFSGILLMDLFDDGDDIIISVFFILFGALIAILCGSTLYKNKKAYIHIEADRVEAFCHEGAALQCSVSDIESVLSLNTFLIIKLKSGKRYALHRLENIRELHHFLQSIILQKNVSSLSRQELLDKRRKLKKLMMHSIIIMILLFVILILGIFLTVALTDGKEISDFSERDMTVFSVMACIGLAFFGLIYLSLRKINKISEELSSVNGTLSMLTAQTYPLPPGNALKIFIDDIQFPTTRLTVFGLPSSDEVYYTIEHIDRNFELLLIDRSELYKNIGEIDGLLDCLIEADFKIPQ